MKKIILASVVLGLVAAGQVQAASYPLTAGRGVNVGTVDVTSDGTNFFVSFNVDDGWVLGATELHIAGDLKAIPQRWGLLMPWRFMGRHAWLNCAKRDAYTFPVGDLGGKDVCVVAHAIIARKHHHRLQIEDAWAGADRFPGGPVPGISPSRPSSGPLPAARAGLSQALGRSGSVTAGISTT